MRESTGFMPGLSPVAGKPVIAAFDGGRLTSDAGILVLAEMIRFRALLIAAGYPDADDGDATRRSRWRWAGCLEAAPTLCSQPTMTRLENPPGPVALKRMMAAMVELFCDSFTEVPRRIVLDIDDTADRVHGQQELALFHAHHDGRCFLPVHVHEVTTGKPVAVILRPGRTPDGAEVTLVRSGTRPSLTRSG